MRKRTNSGAHDPSPSTAPTFTVPRMRPLEPDLPNPGIEEAERWVRVLLERGCPLCGRELLRIRRRPIDIVMSSLAPLRRVRCQNIHCQYEGNLRR